MPSGQKAAQAGTSPLQPELPGLIRYFVEANVTFSSHPAHASSLLANTAHPAEATLPCTEQIQGKARRAGLASALKGLLS